MNVSNTLHSKWFIRLLNIGMIGFVCYWYLYRYLWNTTINWNQGILGLIDWRTNVTPDNSLSIIVIVATFFILAYRYRHLKTNFVFAGIMTIITTVLGIFYFEYFCVPLFDLVVFEDIIVALCASIILVRFYVDKQYNRAFIRRVLYFALIITIPYAIWHFAQIPYAFYYLNGVLHTTSYFDSWTAHVWSIAIWGVVCAICAIMFPSVVFTDKKDSDVGGGPLKPSSD